MSIFEYALFNNTLSAFTKKMKVSLTQAKKEYENNVRADIKAAWEKGKAEARRSGAISFSIDRLTLRNSAYHKYAERIGEDFLSAFMELIEPKCGVISRENKAELYLIMNRYYTAIINLETEAIKRFLASEGRTGQDEPYILPMQSMYTSTLGEYRDRLDAEIEKHNLNAKPAENDIKSKPIHELKNDVLMSGVASEATLKNEFFQRYVDYLSLDEVEWHLIPHIPLDNTHIADYLGFSESKLRKLLDVNKYPDHEFAILVKDYIFPELKKRVETEEHELRSKVLAKEENKEETLGEATKSANTEAYQIAGEYRKNKKPIPYGAIAEQVMMKHFNGVIKRETGKITPNRQAELTKEWKNKRASIRIELMRKYPSKKSLPL
jgi:hypothetical protein